ncbi:MAG: PLD nuclease N-terminal domain-containing protein [Cyclobacteriaceae bacterium]|jgi:hypothetical protein
MVRLLPLIYVLLIALAVWDVLRSDRDAERKALWILAILVVPVIGALFWYAVSRKIFR